MVGNSYDRIASFYDQLSLVLGKSYRESKSLFLEKLDEGDQVLYLGGGTGGNLPEILDRIGKNGKVFYIEASSQMIEKTKKRIPSSFKSQVVFLHQSDFSEIPGETFDTVFTQYFVDILPDNEIHGLFQTINKRIGKNSRWIFVDFFGVKRKRWLLAFMILFFRVFTRNPRKNLPDYSHYFDHYGWAIQQKKLFGNGFIQAWLLERGGRD